MFKMPTFLFAVYEFRDGKYRKLSRNFHNHSDALEYQYKTSPKKKLMVRTFREKKQKTK